MYFNALLSKYIHFFFRTQFAATSGKAATINFIRLVSGIWALSPQPLPNNFPRGVESEHGKIYVISTVHVHCLNYPLHLSGMTGGLQ